MPIRSGHHRRHDNVVHVDIMGRDEHGADDSWPAAAILPLACITGAAIWSLVIYAGISLF